MNSDSSVVSSNQTCQIRRLHSIARPQRYFTLSLPQAQSNSSALNPPPIDDAATPTNQPTHLFPCPSKSPAILLCPPEPDDGPKTPTPSYNSDVTEPALSQDSSIPQNRNQFDAELNNYNNATQKEDSAILEILKKGKRDQEPTKNFDLDAENRKNELREEGGARKDPVVTIKINLIKDESNSSNVEEEGEESPPNLTSLSDSSSQESLAKYLSPFGDVTQTQLFSNSEHNKLGVLDLEESGSTASITIPSVGSAVPPTAQSKSR